MTAPFDVGFREAREAGWWPIPIMGKSMPVRGTTGYAGTVTLDKLLRWTSPDELIRARAGRGRGMDNIALRHHGTLAVDVDAGYGSKDGVEKLRAYAEKADLPALPATWSSTARGADTGSRQHLYRIPADEHPFKTKPCESVELATWHHRFTACSPSLHPTGSTYRWYTPGQPGTPPVAGEVADHFPRVDELPELPTPWLEAFRGGAANADRTVDALPLPELFATFPVGPPDALVRHRLAKWADPSQHVGHDEAKNMWIHAVMLGREGHPGAVDLFQLIHHRFRSYLDQARPEVAAIEVTSLAASCAVIAQQKPLRVPRAQVRAA